MRLKNTNFITILIGLLLPFTPGWAQLHSGIYTNELNIAYDSTDRTITGYFEAYSGFDENTQAPTFSCIFYFTGKSSDRLIRIKSYYPFEENADTIVGSITLLNEQSFEMKLDEEHGGCWNVTHFADDVMLFELTEKKNWRKISYTLRPEVSIYNEPSEKKKLIHKIKKPGVVYIDEIKDEWCFIHYDSNQEFKGWVKKPCLFFPQSSK